MNAESFDRLSQRMGATTSRRSLLKAFGAGVAAAVAGALHLPAQQADAGTAGPSPYPSSFLKGMCYESFPQTYNPSTANHADFSSPPTCGASTAASNGKGVQLFFASDAVRREGAPMWGSSFSLASGQTITGRNDVMTMKNMGVTMIRPYDWDARNDHTQFLDYCQRNGIQVLAAVSNFYLLPPAQEGGYPVSAQAMRDLVNSFTGCSSLDTTCLNKRPKDYHPAIVGVIIGNEPNISGYDQSAPTNTVTVTNAFEAAEAAVFPNGRRPMVGHPVDFTFYYGNSTAPDWGFWDALLPQLSPAMQNRIFLAPQTYNDATYLYDNAEQLGKGYVPATYARYQSSFGNPKPILFTEIGKDRTKAGYLQTIQNQLTRSISYAVANPGQLLGTTFFEFSDKVWKCPTNNCSDTEGSFGAFSHQDPFNAATQFSSVPYVCNMTQCDFVPFHYDYCGDCNNCCNGQTPCTCPAACANQTVNFDKLVANQAVGVITTAYTSQSTCGNLNQMCCGGVGGTCNQPYTCNPSGTCVQTCGGLNGKCCATQPFCQNGFTCNASDICVACGGSAQPCCGGANGTCSNGFTCSSGTCVACGGSSQPCCGGVNGTCNPGFGCNNNGICVATSCGTLNQACCPTNICGSGLVCNGSSICVACGSSSQPCCTGNTCNTNFTCSSGTCVACGALNGPCCGGIGGTCQNNLTCNGSGVCVAASCGGNGQICCSTNPQCANGLACNGGGVCEPCGAQGNICCAGSTCNNGLACTGSPPTCQQSTTCGGLQQACCGGTTCNSSGLTCQSGTCQANGSCGQPGQPCCSTPSPNTCFLSTSVCVSGTCANCGLPNQVCCANNTCQSGNTCCSTGNCNTVDNLCHSCGAAGQPCCGGINGTCPRANVCKGGQCY